MLAADHVDEAVARLPFSAQNVWKLAQLIPVVSPPWPGADAKEPVVLTTPHYRRSQVLVQLLDVCSVALFPRHTDRADRAKQLNVFSAYAKRLVNRLNDWQGAIPGTREEEAAEFARALFRVLLCKYRAFVSE